MASKRLIQVSPQRASLFVQWRFGLTPEAALRFCRRDVIRRPKLEALKQLQGNAAVQWLQIWLVMLNHADTNAAWIQFNKEFPAWTGSADAPAPGMLVAGRSHVDGKQVINSKLRCNCTARRCTGRLYCTCTAAQCDNPKCYKFSKGEPILNESSKALPPTPTTAITTTKVVKRMPAIGF